MAIADATACAEIEAIEVPLRWLEDAADPEVQAWAAGQDRRAGEFLEGRTEIERCSRFLRRNHLVADPPWICVRGNRRLFLRRGGAQAQAVIWLRQGEEERPLFDPAADGLCLDPDHIAVSPSGRYLAFALTVPGETLATLRVYDVGAGMVIEAGVLGTMLPMLAWHPQERGFYYSVCRRLLFAEEHRDGAYWHELGSIWEHDPCVHPCTDGPAFLVYVQPADRDNLLLFKRRLGSNLCSVASCRLEQTFPQRPAPAPATPLIDADHGFVQFIGAARDRWYFHLCGDAPMGKVVAVNPFQPESLSWETVVAEGPHALGRPEHFPGAAKSAVSDAALLLTYVEHAHDVVGHFGLDGTPQAWLEFPVPSTVDAVFNNGDGFEILSQSFLQPRCMTRYFANAPAAKREDLIGAAMPDVDASLYQVRQVFCAAGDGTSIPVYLVHRKGLRRDGSHQLLLYGYGGFGQSITPEYAPEAALWLELGGVYAVANIRGGGEYGEAWRAAGSKLNKQTSFDDFYAVAQYLVDKGYTAPARLCARGISNGGLLTAVCANQRPDLFAAVVSEVPLTDMLGLDRSETGRACTAEYGSPSESTSMFQVLRAYSPLHNIRGGGRGPAQLVVVADKDLTAPPAQAYRYVAARQASLDAEGGDRPVLLRLVRDEGHSRWRHAEVGRVLAEEIAFLHHFTAPGPLGVVTIQG